MIDVKQKTSELLDNLNPKSVLDLGCGKGFKSLRFARKGISVLGIDKKSTEIKQDNFKFVEKDIANFKFEENFNLIITSLVLHYFSKKKAIEMINKNKEHTYPQGHNYIICMSNEDDESKKRPDNFYPSLEELKELYKDWEIIHAVQDFTNWEDHDNLGKHRHNLIIMLVKK